MMLKKLIFIVTGFCMHSWGTKKMLREVNLWNSESKSDKPAGMRIYYEDKCRICGLERVRSSDAI